MRDNFDGNPDWPQVRGLSFDQDHEGHWGWRVDAVLANIRNWMLTYPVPTVVLIHLGTNDCAQAQSVNSTVVELSQLVAAVRERAPSTAILLAKLIPAALTLSITSCITALNERIGVLAQRCPPVHRRSTWWISILDSMQALIHGTGSIQTIKVL